jgi:FAD/FMN-containing dehydrogenase
MGQLVSISHSWGSKQVLTNLKQIGYGASVTLNLLSRGDAGYEDARQDAIWNGRKPNRFPEAIALAEDASDVVDAVRLARERGWRIGVRSGGHSWSGNAIRDGGLLLDVSRINDFAIDVENLTASVGPGTRGADLQQALNDRGLYFPTGTCSSVGVAGYTLGGGASFTGKKDGPAAHALRAIEVVTAEGELVHADDHNHPDLIWAARGGGPNFFAAVTRLHFDLQPLPGAMYTALYVYPVEVIDEFLTWVIDLLHSTPPEVAEMWMAIKSWLPHYDGTILVLFPVVFASSADEALRLLEPFERSPLLEHAVAREPPHPWTFPEGYGLVDQLYVKGNRYRSDALWMNAQSEGFQDAVKDIILSLPTRWSHVLWAPAAAAEHPNAAYSVHSEISVHPYGVCQDPADDPAILGYVEQSLQRLMPHSIGAGKVNDSDLTAFPKDILSKENAARLEKVRSQYDPDGRFHPALGLEPSVSAGV